MDPGIRSRSRPVEPRTAKSRPRLKILLGAVMAASLLFSGTPSTAGPLEDAVDRIETKVQAILNNTGGVQDLVGNVKGVTSGFDPDTFDDLRGALGEAQDLVAFVKAQRDEAGSPSDHPDLVALMGAVEDIVGIVLDDPDFRFGLLTQLLEILPEKVLAAVGMAVSKAGIDADSVAEMQQAAMNLTVARGALLQFDANRGSNSFSRGVESANLEIPDTFACDVLNTTRPALIAANAYLHAWARQYSIIGETMEGTADLVATSQDAGGHGYANLNVSVEAQGTVGKVLIAVSRVVRETARAVRSSLNHCELIWYEQQIMDNAANIREMVLDGSICGGAPMDVAAGGEK